MSLEHLVILLIAGLFILGPERLPQAAEWLGGAVRRVRSFATDTQQQFRSELGDDFEQWREPLQQLNSLRGLDPRRAVTQYLFDEGPGAHDATGSARPSTFARDDDHQQNPREQQSGSSTPFDPGTT